MMKVRRTKSRSFAGYALGFTLVILAGAIAVAPGAASGESTTPGMCNGRSDANVRVLAQARGSIPYRLNVATDSAGRPSGALDLWQGPARLRVTQWCRLWQHIPGQPPGEDGDEEIPEGATIVHVVGTAKLPDGTPVLVRTDLRALADHDGSLGPFGSTQFRVRYRPLGGHDEPTASPAGEDEEEGWVRIPAEGWAPLNLFNLQQVAPAGVSSPPPSGLPLATSVRGEVTVPQP